MIFNRKRIQKLASTASLSVGFRVGGLEFRVIGLKALGSLQGLPEDLERFRALAVQGWECKQRTSKVRRAPGFWVQGVKV